MPTSPDCQIWWARPGHARRAHYACFSDAERGRAARFRRQIDRDRFAVGCALSRLVLAKLLDVPAVEVPLRRRCDTCGGPHGRPRIAGSDWHLSISHSGEHVVVAVTTAGQVGIDVERVRPEITDLAPMILTREELHDLERFPSDRRAADLTRYWVRKEAVLKAVGTGLLQPMTAVRVSNPDARPRLLSIDSPAHCQMTMADLDVDDAHAGSIALMTAEMPNLTHHSGEALLNEYDD